jgi:alanine racemase
MSLLCPSLLPLLKIAGYAENQVIDCTIHSGANLCVIDLTTIAANIALLKNHLPQHTRMMAIVKAHAYGSDSIRMARFFNSCGIDILGVAHLQEAITLRQAGLEGALFVINVTANEANAVASWDLEVGVGNATTIQSLGTAAARAERQLKLHLHIDTGMRRFGCTPSEALELALQINNHPYLHLEGLMTHCVAADDNHYDTVTHSQMAMFDNAYAELVAAGVSIPWLHVANSSATLRFHLPQYNMVRLGLSLWGYYSSPECHKNLDLKPALTLVSQIQEIHTCQQNDTVSYGCSYRIEKPWQRIAVLPIGYCDGLHRHYSGQGHVMIDGILAPMVGSICMDYMMVDVTDIPQATIGMPVVIFGKDSNGNALPLETLATAGHTIAHELITCLGSRIPRAFVTSVESNTEENIDSGQYIAHHLTNKSS